MVLLDTCTLLWLVQDYRQLPKSTQKILEKNQGAVFLSAITPFEIGIKQAKKKLKLPLKPVQWYREVLEFHGLTELPLTGEIMLLAANLPQHHNDPADRMIIATAAFHKMPVLTPDPLIRKYHEIKVVW
ncbi:MAG: type II toxin-antitoxin system VapC family toxin [Turneriella sp.]